MEGEEPRKISPLSEGSSVTAGHAARSLAHVNGLRGQAAGSVPSPHIRDIEDCPSGSSSCVPQSVTDDVWKDGTVVYQRPSDEGALPVVWSQGKTFVSFEGENIEDLRACEFDDGELVFRRSDSFDTLCPFVYSSRHHEWRRKTFSTVHSANRFYKRFAKWRNPPHSCFGPAFSSDNAGDGPGKRGGKTKQGLSKRDKTAINLAVRRGLASSKTGKVRKNVPLQQVNGGTTVGRGAAVRAMKIGASLSADAQYKLGLFDSFNTKVVGVVVPDAYPFPTERSHATRSINYSHASGTPNNNIWDIWPDPCLTIFGAYGLSATAAQSGSMLRVPVTAGGSGADCYGMCTPDDVAKLYTAARVVSFGLRVRNNQPFGSVSGRLVAVPYIIPRTYVTAEMMTKMATTTGGVSSFINSMYMNIHGIPANTPLSLSSPGAIELQMDQLIDNDLLLSFRPVGPIGTTFKMAVNSTPITTGSGGYDMLNAGTAYGDVTGLAFQSGGSEWGDPHDWIGWQLQFVDFPINATQGAELELVCHMEGQPLAGTALVPSSVPANKVGGAGVESILRTVALDALAQLAPPVLLAGKSLLKNMLR